VSSYCTWEKSGEWKKRFGDAPKAADSRKRGHGGERGGVNGGRKLGNTSLT